MVPLDGADERGAEQPTPTKRTWLLGKRYESTDPLASRGPVYEGRARAASRGTANR